MQIAEEVRKFASACEGIHARIMTLRPLTEYEVLFVRHYCDELLKKIPQPLDPQ